MSSESIKREESQVEYSEKHIHHSAEEAKHGDAGLRASEQEVTLTEEDSRRICRKTDKYILSLLAWVYFLQILAQLAAQPVGAFILVKLRPRTIMPIIVFCWGVSLLGMAGSTNFVGLMVSRFLLGLFEALCLPLFSLLTVSWYRRSEQPIRVAVWYSTNGIATIIGSALSYGLGQIKSSKVHSYQLIFIVTGVTTVITAPIIAWKLDNSVSEARFLSSEDRLKGLERLRANNTGVSSTEFKWKHIREFFLDPKTWLFLGMAIAINMGASVITVMGPIVLKGLVGFDSETAVLLNMPFGALQFILIYLSSWAAVRFRTKSITFSLFILPVIIGATLLFTIPRVEANKGPLLLGYYLLAFLFAANPLIITWIASNTAGQTKKSAMITLFNAGSAAGNIVGPYLFKEKDAPEYKPGMQAVLGFFVACEGLIALNVVYLWYMNKQHSKTRVRNGKPANIADLSMTTKYQAQEKGLGEQAFLDLSDKENDEFIYCL